MSDETTALNAFKAILPDIDPAPEPAPYSVWVYPADHKEINFERLPVIIVSRVINQPIPWGRQTFGYGRHRWMAEILVFLTPGPLTNDEQAARAEQKFAPWPRAMADLLYENLRLNDTAEFIGDGEGNLFTYQVGHLHFWTKVMFGLKFLVPVNQKPIQPTSA